MPPELLPEGPASQGSGASAGRRVSCEPRPPPCPALPWGGGREPEVQRGGRDSHWLGPSQAGGPRGASMGWREQGQLDIHPGHGPWRFRLPPPPCPHHTRSCPISRVVCSSIVEDGWRTKVWKCGKDFNTKGGSAGPETPLELREKRDCSPNGPSGCHPKPHCWHRTAQLHTAAGLVVTSPNEATQALGAGASSGDVGVTPLTGPSSSRTHTAEWFLPDVQLCYQGSPSSSDGLCGGESLC